MEEEDELSFKCSEIPSATKHPSKTILWRAGLSFSRIMHVYL